MSIVSLWPKTKRLLRRVYGGPWYKKLLVWLCTLFLLLVLGLVAPDFITFLRHYMAQNENQ